MPFIRKEPLKPEEVCVNEEHHPPTSIYLEPGHYTWQCPGCKKITEFTVPAVIA